jgi:hypothetical protein
MLGIYRGVWGDFCLITILKKLLSRLSAIWGSCPPPMLSLTSAFYVLSSLRTCPCPLSVSLFASMSVRLRVRLFVCLFACLSVCLSLSACLFVRRRRRRCRRSRVVLSACMLHISYWSCNSPSLPLAPCALSCQPPLPLGDPPVGMPCGNASRCSWLPPALSRS